MFDMDVQGGVTRTLMGKIWILRLIPFFCLVLLASVPTYAAGEREAAGQQQVPANQMVEGQAASSQQNPLDEAIKQARQRVEGEPASVKAQVALGFLLLQKGAVEEAGTVFDNALALNARFHDALTGKGIVLARMGEDKEAEEFLQKALILNPNPVRTHYELGLLYEKKGDFAKAVAEYKKGIEKYKQGRK